MPKFLIVTADDFGLDAAVNDAVEKASRCGLLTAASLMVGAPAAADAIRLAKTLPWLPVGLHLVLADGFSLLAHDTIPLLTDATGYMGAEMLGKSVRAFALPRVQRQIEAEIRAQFEAFAASGLHLDHVNCHKHFHVHPTLLGMVIAIGRDYGLSAVRIPNEPTWFASSAGTRRLAAGNLLLTPWIAWMQYRLHRAGVFHNDTLFGIAASGAMTENRVLQVLERLPDGVTEVYLHPATRPGPLTASMRDYRHTEELAALQSDRVRASIAAGKIQVGGFGDARRWSTGT